MTVRDESMLRIYTCATESVHFSVPCIPHCRPRLCTSSVQAIHSMLVPSGWSSTSTTKMLYVVLYTLVKSYFNPQPQTI